ncbi:hypothetical protein [Nocardia sp. NPDC051981]|uniref:hypothetical protein n=1 Tax=Nocardia sp. NPDC051981 TaxID=3155417 RepID=UPI00343D7BD9
MNDSSDAPAWTVPSTPGRGPEDCLIEELTENPAMQAVPALAAAPERLDEDGVTDDFRAGVAFVIALLADPAFGY